MLDSLIIWGMLKDASVFSNTKVKMPEYIYIFTKSAQNKGPYVYVYSYSEYFSRKYLYTLEWFLATQ